MQIVLKTLKAQAAQQGLVAAGPVDALSFNSGKNVNAGLLKQTAASVRHGALTCARVSDRRAQVARLRWSPRKPTDR